MTKWARNRRQPQDDGCAGAGHALPLVPDQPTGRYPQCPPTL